MRCPECGHDEHGRRRCRQFVAVEEEVDIPGLGRCVSLSSSPCNCKGPAREEGEDTSSDRMTVACTLMLNERRMPC